MPDLRYDAYLRQEVIDALEVMEEEIQRQVFWMIDSLRDNPFQKSDEVIEDPSGRLLHAKRIDSVLLLYWVDHLEREIRIVDFDQV